MALAARYAFTPPFRFVMFHLRADNARNNYIDDIALGAINDLRIELGP